MIQLTILYPNTPVSHFDLSYYLETHVPLVRKLLTPVGLVRVDLAEGLAGGSLDTPAAYKMVTFLVFSTMDDLQAALASHAAELLADIPNFTDVEPVIQISRTVD